MTQSLTNAMVERAAAGLATGGWRYTSRQLYYAACAEAEIPPNNAAANGELATGALLALVAFILIRFTVVFATLLALAIVLLGLGVIARVSRRRGPGVRVLAASYESFVKDFGGVERPGLIDTFEAVTPPGDPDALVVCDTDENAESVTANLARAGLESVSVVSAGRMPTHPTGAAVALHDASPRGCALVLDLRDTGVEVLDAGLHPADVDNVETQVLEGAPARMPRDLSPLLDDDEIAWLMSGRRVELATRTPQQLMALVTDALGQVGKHPGAPRSGAPGPVPSLPVPS